MKRVLSILLGILMVFALVLLVDFGKKVEAVEPTELVGWWKLDGNTDDSSNYENHGTANNLGEYLDGIYGKAASFNGTSSYITISDLDNSLDMTTEVSLEAWIWIDPSYPTTGIKNIIRKGHFGSRSYGLDINTTKLRGWVNQSGTGGGTAKISNGTTTLPTGKWVHVAMVYNGSNIKLYLDGIPEGAQTSASGVLFENNLSVRIGGQSSSDSGGALAFKGLIDNVKIWNKAMDIGDIYDTDRDGVTDNFDLCEGTVADSRFTTGTNRFQVDEIDGYLKWRQYTPGKGKNASLIPVVAYEDLSYTYGCSGEEILEMLKDELGYMMEGNWKFGLSSSVVRDFHLDYLDGKIDGIYFVESLEVDSANIDGVDSVFLLKGITYTFSVSGTWTNRPNEIVDAEYTTQNNWTDYNIAPLGGYDNYLLNLWVNSQPTYWGEYSASHTYSITYTPTVTGPINFVVFDGDVTTLEKLPSWYGDNIGSLFVDIYVKLY